LQESHYCFAFFFAFIEYECLVAHVDDSESDQLQEKKKRMCCYGQKWFTKIAKTTLQRRYVGNL
ncbi:6379_t:CDS:1, partial [Racocetra fulgida]